MFTPENNMCIYKCNIHEYIVVFFVADSAVNEILCLADPERWFKTGNYYV